MKVDLQDIALNKKSKRVGFSFLYFFFGPLYLLVRLQYYSLFLLVIYYYCLPIPGMEAIQELLYKIPMDTNAQTIVHNILFYFRSGFNEYPIYIGIFAIFLIHVFLSVTIDNYLLKKKIKKHKLYPVSELDAQKLTYYRIAKPGVRTSQNVAQLVSSNVMAEQMWQEKNLDYTTMISKTELVKKAMNNKKKKNLNITDMGIYSPTREVVNAQTESTGNVDKLTEYERLFQEHKISAEQYELLIKDLKTKK